MDVFEFLDYRAYLKAHYDRRKEANAAYSYRYIGQKVGLDAGYVVKVFQGKYHIAEKSIPAFIKLCKLGSRQAEYFHTLVHFGKAKSGKQAKLLFERLLSLKSVGSRQVEEHQYEFYRKWYYAAVRSLLGYYEFRGDYKALAERLSPAITAAEARSAIALLEKLDFIRKDGSGSYRLTDTLITTGEEWRSIAVKTFQEETLRMAAESLYRHAKEVRDISTATVAIAFADLEAIKARIKEFRESILKLAAKSADVDCVYQFNVQWFPLTDTEDRP